MSTHNRKRAAAAVCAAILLTGVVLAGGSAVIIIARPVIEVEIDVKPGSDPNSVNLQSKGLLPVAILTTDEFDATEVDPDTVTLGDGNGNTESAVKSAEEDVDGDGDTDRIFHFLIQDLVGAGVLDADSEEVVLEGETNDGSAIEGSDSVRIVRRR